MEQSISWVKLKYETVTKNAKNTQSVEFSMNTELKCEKKEQLPHKAPMGSLFVQVFADHSIVCLFISPQFLRLIVYLFVENDVYRSIFIGLAGIWIVYMSMCSFNLSTCLFVLLRNCTFTLLL